jgi:hypothetical protein
MARDEGHDGETGDGIYKEIKWKRWQRWKGRWENESKMGEMME